MYCSTGPVLYSYQNYFNFFLIFLTNLIFFNPNILLFFKETKKEKKRWKRKEL